MFGKGGEIILRGSKEARNRQSVLTAGDFMRRLWGHQVTLSACFLGLVAPPIPSLLPPPPPQ